MAHDLSVSLIRFGHITLAMKNKVLEAVRNIAARRQLWRREDDFVIYLSRKGFGTVLVSAQGGGDPIARMERVGAEVISPICFRSANERCTRSYCAF
jgi:hypothetical protein